MRHLKLPLMVAIFCLSVSIAPGFRGELTPAWIRITDGAMTEEVKKAWLVEIIEILGCHCGCDLTLKECEQDDPDCQLRPILIQKLPPTTESREPSVVMVAPNGAVTALFRGEPPIEHLNRGFVSPKMEEILAAIQQGMTIFLCVGRSNDIAFEKTKQTILSAVRKLGGIATAVWLDPSDRSEKSILSALKYQESTNGALVFVIALTGLLIEKVEGVMTERKLFDSFQRILAMKSGCGQSTITGGSACQPGYGVTGESSCL